MDAANLEPLQEVSRFVIQKVMMIKDVLKYSRSCCEVRGGTRKYDLPAIWGSRLDDVIFITIK